MTGGFAGRFEDERGEIRDLFGGKPVAVTRITTAEGAIRGNHVHRETAQWTLVLSGNLVVANPSSEMMVGPNEMVFHAPGVPHAWKALEHTVCLVFTRGPRSEDYESDTERLQEPLLS